MVHPCPLGKFVFSKVKVFSFVMKSLLRHQVYLNHFGQSKIALYSDGPFC